MTVGAERGGHVVPRPRAEPETGNEHDRCAGHASTYEVAGTGAGRLSRPASGHGGAGRGVTHDHERSAHHFDPALEVGEPHAVARGTDVEAVAVVVDLELRAAVGRPAE